MSDALDSSVLVEALVPSAPHHSACLALLNQGGWVIHIHAIVETFNTITGGRLGFRVPPGAAHKMILWRVMPFVSVALLTPDEVLHALGEAQSRGVRRGIVYDYLHLVTARKALASKFYTLNLADFKGIHRPDDPEIALP